MKAYHDTYKFPVNITRCSNNYGPFQFPEKLIPLIINNTLAHKDLPIYGDGMQVRDWLYVEDHCKAIDMVVRDARWARCITWAATTSGPIFHRQDHSCYIKEHVDPAVGEHMMKHVEDRKGHDRRYGIDPERSRRICWYPETCFEDGIKLTIQWYLDHMDWMKNVTSGEYQKYYQKM